ncbi:hypothetical protein BY458DRAFT_500777 [Sporodiniella umbellata]|nr:hypothetical protein BY458DRAFT_500777 [Sporodiniella umbellata]
MDSFASFLNLKRPAGGKNETIDRKRDQKLLENSIAICFEGAYYDINFGDVSMDQFLVADLKERCKRITGVTLATMKLKVSGAYVKDDSATLQSSGIHRGCVVYVLGEKTNSEQIRQTASGNPEEVGYMTRVSKIMDKVERSKGQIEHFDMLVICIIQGVETSQEKRKEAEDLGIYLNEVLMQALIALDGVDCPQEFQTARADRKRGVKECQELLDRIEGSRASLKQFFSSGTKI